MVHDSVTEAVVLHDLPMLFQQSTPAALPLCWPREYPDFQVTPTCPPDGQAEGVRHHNCSRTLCSVLSDSTINTSLVKNWQVFPSGSALSVWKQPQKQV